MKRMVISGLLLLATAAFSRPTAAFHLRLERSDPAADTTIAAAPDSIRLWFSERVQINVTTIRLTTAGGDEIETAPAHLGTGVRAPVIAAVRGRGASGRYQVAWQTMSRDGHVVRGAFSYIVANSTPAR